MEFHLESTPESAKAIVDSGGYELIPSQYVQTKEDIFSAKPENYNSINQLMGDIPTYLQQI